MEIEKGRGKKSSPDKVTKEMNLPYDGGSSAKRKCVDVEPRTPLKRQKVPVQKFQSPAEELIPIPSPSKQKDAQERIHKKGTFLGIRVEEGSFALCKTLQNVFDNTRKFRIQWLDLCNPPDVYKIDFPDSTDADCILTNVKMERLEKDMFKLSMKEQTRVEEILRKALRVEPVDDIIKQGMSGSEEEDNEEEEDVVEEEWEEELEEEKPKKSKGQAKSRKSATQKSGKKTPAKETKDTKQKPEKKRGPDKNLKPNPKMKVLEKDPFLETRSPPRENDRSGSGRDERASKSPHRRRDESPDKKRARVQDANVRKTDK